MSERDQPDEPVLLTRLGDLTSARLLCGRLAAEGIDAFLPDERMADQTWHLQGPARGIRVQVRQADLERANQVLAQPSAGMAVEDEEVAAAREQGGGTDSDDGTISAGDRAAFRALRVALVTLIVPGLVHPYSLGLAVAALRRPDVTPWGRGRAIAALLVSCAGLACLGWLAYRALR